MDKLNKMDERILVADREWLFTGERTTFQGFVSDEPVVKHFMTKLNNTYEVRRGDAEENLDWKQPIPYCIIKRGDQVFLYERLEAGGEERLHNQLSIGVGGHMNNLDPIGDWKNNLILNLIKELNEELHINLDDFEAPKVVGFINDDVIEPGPVHFGILVVIEAVYADSEVSVKETDKLDGYWVRIQDLKKTPLFDRLESWSKMAVEIL